MRKPKNICPFLRRYISVTDVISAQNGIRNCSGLAWRRSMIISRKRMVAVRWSGSTLKP
jgi:hypothetical protein